MRLVLFTFSIIVATTVLNTPTKAQNYPGARFTVGVAAAVKIVASQHFNNARSRWVGGAAFASRIRNTCLHSDHILTLG